MKMVPGSSENNSDVTAIHLATKSELRGICLPSSRRGRGQVKAATQVGGAEGEKGGRTTNSPPAKVGTVPGFFPKILASGVDSLVLTIDVVWHDTSFFEYLDSQKAIAKQEDKDTSVFIGNREGEERLLLNLKPFGHKGHEWVLLGEEYALSIGNWLEPKSRPSINATIRSETLWSRGPEKAVDILLNLLRLSGAHIQTVKPSRVDLCVDYLMPEKRWSKNLERYMVKRATKCSSFTLHNVFSGFSIGQKKLVGRLYDKPLEIRQRSQKLWMYDVWGLDSVPEGYRIVRVEGQFRREVIKELGIDSASDLFRCLDNLWAYFTRIWLKFQNNPGKHHLARKTLPFWATIQNGFYGVQNARPLLRCQVSNAREKQLAAQNYGTLGSLIALRQEVKGIALGQETTLVESLAVLGRAFEQQGKNDFELNIDIMDKRGKYHKATEKMIETQKQRQELGFPCNLPPIDLNTKE